MPGPVTVSGVSATAATFSAPLGTGNEPTRWGFVFNGGKGDVLSWPTVAATPNPTVVAGRLTNLIPNTHYTVALEAYSDPDGIPLNGWLPVTGPSSSFSTPIEPAVPVRIRTRSRSVLISDEIKFSGRTATADPKGHWYLETEPAGSHRFRKFIDIASTLPLDGAIGGNRRFTVVTSANRNTRFRVRLDGTILDRYRPDLGGHVRRKPTVSNAIRVDVWPTVSLTSSQDTPGGAVTMRYSAEIHSMPGRWRGPSAYFYDSGSRHGPFSLVAVSRLRRQGGPMYGHQWLLATARVAPTASARYEIACVKRQIVRDMGRPFRDPSCGRPVLNLR